jgi:arylsulfatase A-like enzyme/thioredoxin-like negative regulator of GroEL
MRRLCVLLLLLLMGCGARETPVDTPVFLISIDTLRSDRIRADLTPNIVALAHDGVTFERAFSHVPQTLPSHATMLTGLVPSHAGVRDNIGYTLAANVATLPALLKANGYATGAAVSSYVLRRSTGIANGFDFFDDHLEGQAVDVTAERGGERTAAALTQWLDAQQSRKLFAFLHLYEPHAPYPGGYDADVSRADKIVGDFLAHLKQRGFYDNALIVLVSDHGEGLGDHGEPDHGVFVYREAIQVPLIVKLPRRERAGERVQALAALSDVTPTILGILGIDPPKLDGLDLLHASIPADREVDAESYYPRLHFHWSELTSVITARHQYIQAPRAELYDWQADPSERRNLLADERRAAHALATSLARRVSPPAPPSQVDAEDQRKLAALGYVGSAGESGAGDYPDPKDRIQYLAMYRRAEALPLNEAVPLLQTVTREAPEIVDAWLRLAAAQPDRAIPILQEASKRFNGNAAVVLPLADAYLRAARYDEARAHAELALRSDPVVAHEMLAKIALAQGDMVTAGKHAQESFALAPERTATLLMLARIAQRQQDWPAALSALDRIKGSMRGVQADRGEALLHLARGPEAEQAFRAEVQAYPDNVHAWGNLAVVLAAQGRTDEATRTVDEALRRNPAATKMASEVRALIRESGSR